MPDVLLCFMKIFRLKLGFWLGSGQKNVVAHCFLIPFFSLFCNLWKLSYWNCNLKLQEQFGMQGNSFFSCTGFLLIFFSPARENLRIATWSYSEFTHLPSAMMFEGFYHLHHWERRPSLRRKNGNKAVVSQDHEEGDNTTLPQLPCSCRGTRLGNALSKVPSIQA